MKLNAVTLQRNGRGFEVIDPQTGATTDLVTLGEMLEQVLGVFGFTDKTYPMKTREQWDEEMRGRVERADQRRKEEKL